MRPLIPENIRVRLRIDTISITPTDKDGNCCANVIDNHKTKHTTVYAAKSYDAETATAAIFTYISRYGLVDEVISDPESAFTGESVGLVNEGLGMRRKASLVDVHTSNGVERSNQEILKLLRGLVNDERVRDQWSKPWNLGLIKFQLNSRFDSLMGPRAFALMFGKEDLKFFKLQSHWRIHQSQVND